MLIKSMIGVEGDTFIVSGWVNIFDYENCNDAIMKSNVYNKEASQIIWPTKEKADQQAVKEKELWNLELLSQVFVGGKNG